MIIRCNISTSFIICFFPFFLAGQNFTKKIFLDSTFKQCDSIFAAHVSYIAYTDSIKLGGFVKTTSLEGIIESENNFSDLEKKIENGECKLYRNNQIYITNYDAGKIMKGDFVTFYKSGQLKRKDFYENGKLINGKCFARDGSDTAYYDFEIMPKFPGGEQKLFEFIRDNLKYPKEEKENNIMGKVFLTFIIDKSGYIIDVVPIKEVHGGKGLTAEAIRVMYAMPQWIPGMQDGERVNVQYNVPINFTLTNNTRRKR